MSRDVPHILLITIALSLAGCGLCRRPIEPAPAPPPPVRISLVFGGDVMQHLPQVAAARRDSTYDYADCFAHLKPLFDSADLAIVNFETTISADGQYSGYPRFASPAELAEALHDAGVNAVMLANNHIADKGRAGIEATARALDEAELRYTGAFPDSARAVASHPLLLEAKGVRFAFFNYTYDTNGMPVPKGTVVNEIDTVRMAADLAAFDRTRADFLIFFMHWGYEYTPKPSREQRELAAWAHARGVDFVIGSHPHVIQPVETLTDTTGRITGVTAFSLGNLVSAQRKRRTDGGMLLRLDLTLSDSLPPVIEPSYLLTWVYTPHRNGRMDYRVLPSYVADTLLKSDPAAQKAYELFASDARAVLAADSLMREAAGR